MAKRVNKRFLLMLTFGVMGVLILGTAAAWWLRRGNVQEYLARADQAWADYQLVRDPAALEKDPAAKERLEKAINDPARNPESKERLKQAQNLKDARHELLKIARDNYVRALRRRSTDVELLVRLGDVMREITRYDPVEALKHWQAWEQAVEVNPTYLPALERLLDAAVDQVEVWPTSVSAYQNLERRAQSMLRAKPDDVRAKSYIQIATLGRWMANTPMPDATVNAAIDELAKLNQQKPDEFQIPRYIGRARLRQAEDRAIANDLKGANERAQEAVKAFEISEKAQPDNPRLLWYKFEILARAVRYRTPSDTATHEQINAFQRGLMDEAVAILRKSQQLAKPSDQDYFEIHNAYATSLARQGKREEAEGFFRQLAETLPNDLVARHRYANFLRERGKLREAIEVLNKPIDMDPQVVGARAWMQKEYQLRQVLDQANMRVALYTLPDTTPSERAGLRSLVEESYRRLSGFLPEDNPRLLTLKGNMLLAFENTPRSRYEAVRVLQQAYDKLEQNRSAVEPELILRLARVYMDLQQSGQAKTLLTKLVDQYPADISVRRSLIEVLLGEKQTVEASNQIARLKEFAPDDPAIAAFQFELLMAEGNTEKAKAAAQALPEKTTTDKWLKARAMLKLKEMDAAAKLLAPAAQSELETPAKAYPMNETLVQIYLFMNRQPDALRVAQAVRQKAPEDARWKELEKIASAEQSAEARAKLQEELIEGISDPGARAMSRYDVLIRQGKVDEAYAGLADAFKSLPENGQIAERLFNHAVEERKLDDAQAYAATLAKLDWDQAGGLYYQARLKLAKRDIDGALKDAQELSRRVPELARTWVLLGETQQESGDLESALTSYNKALDKQLDNGRALQGLVQVNWKLGRIEAAKQYIQQGMKLTTLPYSSYFEEMSRRAEEYAGDPTKVTADRLKERDANPDLPATWLALSRNYLNCATVAAKDRESAAQAEEYLGKARATLDGALKKWPDNLQICELLANVLIQMGKPQDAADMLEKLKDSERWKTKPEPCLLLAEVLRFQGRAGLDRAEKAMLEAVVRSSNAPDIRRNLADFYKNTGQTDKAIAVLSDLAKTTSDPAVRHDLIDVQVQARRYADAEALLGELLKQSPTDARLRTMLGYVKVRQGDFDAGARELAAAIQADSKYAEAHRWLGMLRVERGDISGAISELEEAKNLSPGDADIRASLANAYRRQNSLDAAIREMQAAIERQPLRPDLRLMLLKYYEDDQRWAAADKLLAEAQSHPDLMRDPIWYEREARLALKRGDAQRAASAITRAWKVAPGDERVFYSLLDIASQVGAHDQVIQITGTILQKQEGYMPWWLFGYRGLARAKQNQPQLAVPEFEKALGIVDDGKGDMAADQLADLMVRGLSLPKTYEMLSIRKDLRWKVALARLYMQAADFETARRYVHELLTSDYDKLSPQQRLLALQIGGPIYHASGARDLAQQTYIRYLAEAEKYPMNVEPQLTALNNLALLLAEHPTSPNPAQALTYSRKAYDMMNRFGDFVPSIADTHGWILVLTGRVDEGIELLRTAAAKDLPDAFYHLGEAYIRTSQGNLAQSNLQRAAELMQEARKKNLAVDPDLEKRIAAAMEKAKMITKSAAQAAP